MRLKKFVLRNETQDESGTEVLEIEQEVDTAEEVAEESTEETPEQTAEESDEVVISIGDEPIEGSSIEDEGPLALRIAYKNLKKEVKELRALKESITHQDDKPISLGKKPSLSDDDIDYDADKFEVRLTEWHERKRKIEQQELEQKREQDDIQRSYSQKLIEYQESKKALKVRDFDDAEAAVLETLSVAQQSVVVKVAKNKAAVIYALGKNPQTATRLAKIKDIVEFTSEIKDLETQLKVTNRKAPPPPEKVVQGTGRVSGAVSSELERLRAEAEKTGDMSKVIAYKKANRK